MMFKKNDIAEVLKVGVILFVITAVAAAILAGVNSYTAPVIAENNKKAQEKALRAVLPEADNIAQIEYKPDEGSTVIEIYDGAEAGYAVKTTPNGYGGKIEMVVGIDSAYKVTGIEIISQSETAGLGSNCTGEEFRAQFVGKTENIAVVKNGASGNQIDAISSATVTSKAVTKGVNDAISALKAMKGDE